MAKQRPSPFVAALITTLAGVFLSVAQPVAQRSAAAQAQAATDAEWLCRDLEIKEGSVVGEIGAGAGELTLLVAHRVGPSGRVLSNELNVDRMKAIGTAAAADGLTNVTPVQGA